MRRSVLQQSGNGQTVQYESMSSKDVVSVTTTPYISAYEIRRGEDLLLSSASSSGVPPVIFLARERRKSKRANGRMRIIVFFTRVDIPQSVMDPAKKRGLGASSISNRGVVKANR